MDYKLQCMNKEVAAAANKRWPACTIQLSSALICFGITPDQLGYIQQFTGAHTVRLTRYDSDQIDVHKSISGTNKTVF